MATVVKTTSNLQSKIDSILPKSNICYGWLSKSLIKMNHKENANSICDYVIAMRQEINISESTRRNIITSLSVFSNRIDKDFKNVNYNDMLMYMQQSFRKSDNDDPSHKWINTYNLNLATIQKFYKWLYYPNVSAEERALPECVSGPGLKRVKNKELARYAPSDLWTQEEHSIFLKYCPSIRIRAYHAMALDTSARPHELLNLKIKDLKERVIPAQKDKENVITRPECVVFQFMVRGKTGTRGLVLTNSMSYVMKWLEHHPQRGNKDAYLFQNRNGTKPIPQILLKIYTSHYKKETFPRLLNNENVPQHDKEIIQTMINERKWNPYILRHCALTMKAKNRLYSDSMLRQHAGWGKNSNMPSVYFHNYGNESIDELLRIQGYLPKEDGQFDFNPYGVKKCGNCGTQNLPEAISCSKCKLLIDSVAYQEILKEQEEKEKEFIELKNKLAELQFPTNKEKIDLDTLKKEFLELKEMFKNRMIQNGEKL